MPRPPALPEWNTDGSNRVEPSAGEKAVGYSVNQVPSSSKLNWWMNAVHEWVTYLDGFVTGLFSTINTWTARQLFNAGVVASGAEVGADHLELTGTAPAVTTGTKNLVTPANVVKAWAVIHGMGGSPSAIEDGYNVASVSENGNSSWRIHFPFEGRMANGTYAVIVTSVGTPALVGHAILRMQDYFDVELKNVSSNAVAGDPVLTTDFGVSFCVLVLGGQTLP
jgi:hypothetical protein